MHEVFEQREQKSTVLAEKWNRRKSNSCIQTATSRGFSLFRSQCQLSTSRPWGVVNLQYAKYQLPRSHTYMQIAGSRTIPLLCIVRLPDAGHDICTQSLFVMTADSAHSNEKWPGVELGLFARWF